MSAREPLHPACTPSLPICITAGQTIALCELPPRRCPWKRTMTASRGGAGSFLRTASAVIFLISACPMGAEGFSCIRPRFYRVSLFADTGRCVFFRAADACRDPFLPGRITIYLPSRAAPDARTRARCSRRRPGNCGRLKPDDRSVPASAALQTPQCRTNAFFQASVFPDGEMTHKKIGGMHTRLPPI